MQRICFTVHSKTLIFTHKAKGISFESTFKSMLFYKLCSTDFSKLNGISFFIIIWNGCKSHKNRLNNDQNKENAFPEDKWKISEEQGLKIRARSRIVGPNLPLLVFIPLV